MYSVDRRIDLLCSGISVLTGSSLLLHHPYLRLAHLSHVEFVVKNIVHQPQCLSPFLANATYHISRFSSFVIPPSSPSSSPPITNSLNPVSNHNLFANPGSSIWNLSLTLTASPFFGFPGVVTSGSIFKKFTYVLHSADVKKLRTMTIWFSTTGSR